MDKPMTSPAAEGGRNEALGRMQREAALAAHAQAMMTRITMASDPTERENVVRELILAVIAIHRLEPDVDVALQVREQNVQLDQAGGTADIDEVIVERMLPTIAIRLKGLDEGSVNSTAFYEGINRQVGNIIAGLQRSDAPRSDKPRPRSINYGRPATPPPAV
ncbi:MAG: hypothetical protein V1723_01415 [Candidatus Uhrbacteria bacterium]